MLTCVLILFISINLIWAHFQAENLHSESWSLGMFLYHVAHNLRGWTEISAWLGASFCSQICPAWWNTVTPSTAPAHPTSPHVSPLFVWQWQQIMEVLTSPSPPQVAGKAAAKLHFSDLCWVWTIFYNCPWIWVLTMDLGSLRFCDVSGFFCNAIWPATSVKNQWWRETSEN